jgi:S1-C subfamily serine protease
MRLRVFQALAFALLVVVCDLAQSASWLRIGTTRDGEYSVDAETLSLSDGLVHYWEEWKLSSPKTTPEGKAYQVSVLYLAVDCEGRKFAIANVALYTADRAFVKNISVPQAEWKFKDIVPDTARDKASRYACTHVQTSGRNTNAPATVTAPAERQEQVTVTGSGFALDRKGTVVTNQHVIKDCHTFQVRQSGRSYPAQLVATDATYDLAILRTNVAFPEIALRSNPSAVGETVYVAGFPLAGVLAEEMNFTDGVVASEAGIAGNLAELQITAPVQQGNSGGPVLDQAGNAIGVVVGKLDAVRVAGATGDIPQNVNFAIKVDVLRMFMDANRLSYTSRPSTAKLDAVQVANGARRSTVQVVCR